MIKTTTANGKKKSSKGHMNGKGGGDKFFEGDAFLVMNSSNINN
jgi:hypothetical protein